MRPEPAEPLSGTTEDPRQVSARFLADFFRALGRQGVSAQWLLGDLPIALDDHGGVVGAVDWADFVTFMERLEHDVGGPEGLERIGASLEGLATTGALSSLAGLAASPWRLYRAASGWALRRAMPAIDARLRRVDETHFEIEARIDASVAGCPQILHLATGAARSLPRVIGLPDAVVSAEVDARRGHYRIVAPPSPTLFAKARRLLRAIFSSGSVLRFLETQQLELLAKNAELEQANAALAESERRVRALVDTAVDVLCEIDARGRILYVSASIEGLIGYSPEQVVGSHYRLWLAREDQPAVDEAFDSMLGGAAGRAATTEAVLHVEGGGRRRAEITARSHEPTPGDRRIVCTLRDVALVRGIPTFGPTDDTGVTTRGGAPARDDPRTGDEPRAGAIAPGAADPLLAIAAPHDDEPVEADWIETRKLTRQLADRLRIAGHHRAVEVDEADAPTALHADEAILVTALTDLLAWATDGATADGARAGLAIRDAIEQSAGSAPRRSVVFEVRAAGAGATDGVALERATAAARTLGGRLVGVAHAEHALQRIHLPQPAIDPVARR